MLEVNIFNDSKIGGIGREVRGRPPQIKIEWSCTGGRNPQGNCLYNEIALYSCDNGLS